MLTNTKFQSFNLFCLAKHKKINKSTQIEIAGIIMSNPEFIHLDLFIYKESHKSTQK